MPLHPLSPLSSTLSPTASICLEPKSNGLSTSSNIANVCVVSQVWRRSCNHLTNYVKSFCWLELFWCKWDTMYFCIENNFSLTENTWSTHRKIISVFKTQVHNTKQKSTVTARSLWVSSVWRFQCSHIKKSLTKSTDNYSDVCFLWRPLSSCAFCRRDTSAWSFQAQINPPAERSLLQCKSCCNIFQVSELTETNTS